MRTYKILLSTALAVSICFGTTNVNAGGSGGGGAGLWQAKGQSIVYTNRFVGIGLNDPSERVEILGGFLLHGSAYIDSFLTALEVNAGSITTGNLLVTGNTQLNGLLTIGNTLTFDGTNNSISSSSGTVDFVNADITTTGNIDAGQILVNGSPVNGGKWTVTGDDIYYTDGSVGIGTSTPDVNSKIHIVPDKQYGVYKKAISVELPVLDQKGTLSAFSVTGGTDYSTVRGTFWGRIGYAKAFSADGDMIGGVQGYVKPSHIASNYSGYKAFAIGAACVAILDNLTIGSPGVGETWVGGLYADLRGSISNYPSVGHGAVSAVIGNDQIKGNRTYAGWFDGKGYFSDRLGIGTESPQAELDVVGDIRASGDITTGGDLVTTGSVNATRINVDTANFERLVTGRIVSPDSLIYFGDSSLYINTALNTIGSTDNIININGSSKPFGPYPPFPYTNLRINHSIKSSGIVGSWDLITNSNNTFQIANNITNKTVLTLMDTGNVGIGTTSPDSKLDVEGDVNINGNALYIYGKNTGNGFRIRSSPNFFGTNKDAVVFEKRDCNANDPDGGIAFVNTGVDDDEETAMVIRGSGNVGIGTSNPTQAKLVVNGNVFIEGDPADLWTSYHWKVILKTPNGSAWRTDNTGAYLNRYLGFGMTDNGSSAGWWWFSSPGKGDVLQHKYHMYLHVDNNTLDAQLNVCGNIKAKEVEVDASWCDYVFEDDHQRMTWQEKARFIKENKHLPGIDPGKKIEEEGLSVGKTMAGITLNVEENRLDITDLYEMYYELKKENTELKQQLADLEAK